MLSSVLVSVQDWLRELHVLHTENLDQASRIGELNDEVCRLSDRNRTLEKT